jgi:uncharacterized protein YqeY
VKPGSQTIRSKKSWLVSPKSARKPLIYTSRGARTTAAELAEKVIIDAYLPEQLGEAELVVLVDEEVAKAGSPTVQDMGRIIGAVRTRAGGTADGALIAKLVKEKLSQ